MRFTTITELIHNTPIVALPYFSCELNLNIYVKLEGYNPGGSFKDRVVLHCIENAEKSGQLVKGSILLESTSGSLGVGLALVGSRRGYDVTCVVDPKTTSTNLQLMRMLGASVIVVDEADEHGNYLDARINTVKALLDKDSRYWWLNQYSNPSNPDAHFKYTGPEIMADMKGNVDWIVAPVGTGGLVGGLSRYFKQVHPACKIMAVDALGSVALGGKPGPRRQIGIGSKQQSHHVDLDLIDELVYVSDTESFVASRLLAQKESLFLGCSSGSAFAAILNNKQRFPENCSIVFISADGGFKYADTIYNDEWIAKGIDESDELQAFHQLAY